MAVVVTAPYVTATGNGATTSFPFALAVRNVADVAVYVNGVSQTVGFSVTLNTDFNGGTVLFTTAPVNAATILIAVQPSLSQQIKFVNSGPYNPSTVDGANDAAAIRDIFLQGQISRAPLVPLGETMGAIPAKASRIGLVFGFDGGGNPVALNPGGADSALRTDLVATTGSSLVSWIASGVGAVVRTLQSKLRDHISVKDFGAVVNGIADDSAAVTAALATTSVVMVPSSGVLKTDTAPTTFNILSFGGSFSGAAPLDGPYPAFGPGVVRAIMRGTVNCIIGIAHNNSASNTNAEPVGVTGYGRVDNTGNVAFGMFGRADLHAITGVVTNEFDSFNFGAAPNVANLPPNRAIGTTQSVPIGLTVAAGGTFNSLIGVHICREGSAPQSFLVGQYIASDACVDFGLVIDAVAGSTFVPALIKHGVGAIGVQLQGVGTPVAANAAFEYVDGNGVVQWALKQSGAVVGQGFTSASGGVGYATGAGGAVTQLTSKATAVADNKACGQITLNAASLAANTVASFTFTNSNIAATDIIRINTSGAATPGSYLVQAENLGAGSCTISIRNLTAGALAEALVLNFAIIKAVAA